MLSLKGSVLPLNHTWAISKYFVIFITYTQQEKYFDIIVNGAGPAGYVAAMHVKRKGFGVALVTDKAKVDGSRTHSATILSRRSQPVSPPFPISVR